MADGPTSLIGGITRSMHNLADRQRVISENIANSETPHFKARDVEAPDFSAMLRAQGGSKGAPRVARPHITITSGMTALGARPPASATDIIMDRNTTETKPDGNNVTLEEQLLKMGTVQSDFTAMTNLYRKQMGLLKTALGRSAN
ncbi:flagellar biosynthesis protein FlgB [Sphingomonas quercus]|uniref:Flagellar basal body rod protein FlgB n=1 Tax=Sphingomonas quercus TaxID=2842451 RepID=A0ABS6BMS8_9SPHN|nr:flagellar biosynthesis protein FlgB [Sphingomonas quercus]MBU3078681.1 flagellar biosynthesis protein FlgB [Sphingomonas quercus]